MLLIVVCLLFCLHGVGAAGRKERLWPSAMSRSAASRAVPEGGGKGPGEQGPEDNTSGCRFPAELYQGAGAESSDNAAGTLGGGFIASAVNIPGASEPALAPRTGRDG